MKRYTSFKIVTYFPKSECARHALAQRVADVHAGAVQCAINRLACSHVQKLEMLDTIISAVRENQGAPHS